MSSRQSFALYRQGQAAFPVHSQTDGEQYESSNAVAGPPAPPDLSRMRSPRRSKQRQQGVNLEFGSFSSENAQITRAKAYGLTGAKGGFKQPIVPTGGVAHPRRSTIPSSQPSHSSHPQQPQPSSITRLQWLNTGAGMTSVPTSGLDESIARINYPSGSGLSPAASPRTHSFSNLPYNRLQQQSTSSHTSPASNPINQPLQAKNARSYTEQKESNAHSAQPRSVTRPSPFSSASSIGSSHYSIPASSHHNAQAAPIGLTARKAGLERNELMRYFRSNVCLLFDAPPDLASSAGSKDQILSTFTPSQLDALLTQVDNDVPRAISHLKGLDQAGSRFHSIEELSEAIEASVANRRDLFEFVHTHCSKLFPTLPSLEYTLSPHHMDQLLDQTGSGFATMSYFESLLSSGETFGNVDELSERVRALFDKDERRRSVMEYLQKHVALFQSQVVPHSEADVNSHPVHSNSSSSHAQAQAILQSITVSDLDALLGAAGDDVPLTLILLHELEESRMDFLSIAELIQAVQNQAAFREAFPTAGSTHNSSHRASQQQGTSPKYAYYGRRGSQEQTEEKVNSFNQKPIPPAPTLQMPPNLTLSHQGSSSSSARSGRGRRPPPMDSVKQILAAERERAAVAAEAARLEAEAQAALAAAAAAAANEKASMSRSSSSTLLAQQVNPKTVSNRRIGQQQLLAAASANAATLPMLSHSALFAPSSNPIWNMQGLRASVGVNVEAENQANATPTVLSPQNAVTTSTEPQEAGITVTVIEPQVAQPSATAPSSQTASQQQLPVPPSRAAPPVAGPRAAIRRQLRLEVSPVRRNDIEPVPKPVAAAVTVAKPPVAAVPAPTTTTAVTTTPTPIATAAAPVTAPKQSSPAKPSSHRIVTHAIEILPDDNNMEDSPSNVPHTDSNDAKTVVPEKQVVFQPTKIDSPVKASVSFAEPELQRKRSKPSESSSTPLLAPVPPLIKRATVLDLSEPMEMELDHAIVENKTQSSDSSDDSDSEDSHSSKSRSLPSHRPTSLQPSPALRNAQEESVEEPDSPASDLDVEVVQSYADSSIPLVLSKLKSDACKNLFIKKIERSTFNASHAKAILRASGSGGGVNKDGSPMRTSANLALQYLEDLIATVLSRPKPFTFEELIQAIQARHAIHVDSCKHLLLALKQDECLLLSIENKQALTLTDAENLMECVEEDATNAQVAILHLNHVAQLDGARFAAPYANVRELQEAVSNFIKYRKTKLIPRSEDLLRVFLSAQPQICSLLWEDSSDQLSRAGAESSHFFATLLTSVASLPHLLHIFQVLESRGRKFETPSDLLVAVQREAQDAEKRREEVVQWLQSHPPTTAGSSAAASTNDLSKKPEPPSWGDVQQVAQQLCDSNSACHHFSEQHSSTRTSPSMDSPIIFLRYLSGISVNISGHTASYATVAQLIQQVSLLRTQLESDVDALDRLTLATHLLRSGSSLLTSSGARRISEIELNGLLAEFAPVGTHSSGANAFACVLRLEGSGAEIPLENLQSVVHESRLAEAESIRSLQNFLASLDYMPLTVEQLSSLCWLNTLGPVPARLVQSHFHRLHQSGFHPLAKIHGDAGFQLACDAIEAAHAEWLSARRSQKRIVHSFLHSSYCTLLPAQVVVSDGQIELLLRKIVNDSSNSAVGNESPIVSCAFVVFAHLLHLNENHRRYANFHELFNAVKSLHAEASQAVFFDLLALELSKRCMRFGATEPTKYSRVDLEAHIGQLGQALWCDTTSTILWSIHLIRTMQPGENFDSIRAFFQFHTNQAASLTNTSTTAPVDRKEGSRRNQTRSSDRAMLRAYLYQISEGSSGFFYQTGLLRTLQDSDFTRLISAASMKEPNESDAIFATIELLLLLQREGECFEEWDELVARIASLAEEIAIEKRQVLSLLNSTSSSWYAPSVSGTAASAASGHPIMRKIHVDRLFQIGQAGPDTFDTVTNLVSVDADGAVITFAGVDELIRSIRTISLQSIRHIDEQEPEEEEPANLPASIRPLVTDPASHVEADHIESESSSPTNSKRIAQRKQKRSTMDLAEGISIGIGLKAAPLTREQKRAIAEKEAEEKRIAEEQATDVTLAHQRQAMRAALQCSAVSEALALTYTDEALDQLAELAGGVDMAQLSLFNACYNCLHFDQGLALETYLDAENTASHEGIQQLLHYITSDDFTLHTRTSEEEPLSEADARRIYAESLCGPYAIGYLNKIQSDSSAPQQSLSLDAAVQNLSLDFSSTPAAIAAATRHFPALDELIQAIKNHHRVVAEQRVHDSNLVKDFFSTCTILPRIIANSLDDQIVLRILRVFHESGSAALESLHAFEKLSVRFEQFDDLFVALNDPQASEALREKNIHIAETKRILDAKDAAAEASAARPTLMVSDAVFADVGLDNSLSDIMSHNKIKKLLGSGKLLAPPLTLGYYTSDRIDELIQMGGGALELILSGAIENELCFADAVNLEQYILQETFQSSDIIRSIYEYLISDECNLFGRDPETLKPLMKVELIDVREMFIRSGCGRATLSYLRKIQQMQQHDGASNHGVPEVFTDVNELITLLKDRHRIQMEARASEKSMLRAHLSSNRCTLLPKTVSSTLTDGDILHLLQLNQGNASQALINLNSFESIELKFETIDQLFQAMEEMDSNVTAVKEQVRDYLNSMHCLFFEDVPKKEGESKDNKEDSTASATPVAPPTKTLNSSSSVSALKSPFAPKVYSMIDIDTLFVESQCSVEIMSLFWNFAFHGLNFASGPQGIAGSMSTLIECLRIAHLNFIARGHRLRNKVLETLSAPGRHFFAQPVVASSRAIDQVVASGGALTVPILEQLAVEQASFGSFGELMERISRMAFLSDPGRAKLLELLLTEGDKLFESSVQGVVVSMALVNQLWAQLLEPQPYLTGPVQEGEQLFEEYIDENGQAAVREIEEPLLPASTTPELLCKYILEFSVCGATFASFPELVSALLHRIHSEKKSAYFAALHKEAEAVKEAQRVEAEKIRVEEEKKAATAQLNKNKELALSNANANAKKKGFAEQGRKASTTRQPLPQPVVKNSKTTTPQRSPATSSKTISVSVSTAPASTQLLELLSSPSCYLLKEAACAVDEIAIARLLHFVGLTPSETLSVVQKLAVDRTNHCYTIESLVWMVQRQYDVEKKNKKGTAAKKRHSIMNSPQKTQQGMLQLRDRLSPSPDRMTRPLFVDESNRGGRASPAEMELEKVIFNRLRGPACKLLPLSVSTKLSTPAVRWIVLQAGGVNTLGPMLDSLESRGRFFRKEGSLGVALRKARMEFFEHHREILEWFNLHVTQVQVSSSSRDLQEAQLPTNVGETSSDQKATTAPVKPILPLSELTKLTMRHVSLLYEHAGAGGYCLEYLKDFVKEGTSFNALAQLARAMNEQYNKSIAALLVEKHTLADTLRPRSRCSNLFLASTLELPLAEYQLVQLLEAGGDAETTGLFLQQLSDMDLGNLKKKEPMKNSPYEEGDVVTPLTPVKRMASKSSASPNVPVRALPTGVASPVMTTASVSSMEKKVIRSLDDILLMIGTVQKEYARAQRDLFNFLSGTTAAGTTTKMSSSHSASNLMTAATATQTPNPGNGTDSPSSMHPTQSTPGNSFVSNSVSAAQQQSGARLLSSNLVNKESVIDLFHQGGASHFTLGYCRLFAAANLSFTSIESLATAVRAAHASPVTRKQAARALLRTYLLSSTCKLFASPIPATLIPFVESASNPDSPASDESNAQLDQLLTLMRGDILAALLALRALSTTSASSKKKRMKSMAELLTRVEAQGQVALMSLLMGTPIPAGASIQAPLPAAPDANVDPLTADPAWRGPVLEWLNAHAGSILQTSDSPSSSSSSAAAATASTGENGEAVPAPAPAPATVWTDAMLTNLLTSATAGRSLLSYLRGFVLQSRKYPSLEALSAAIHSTHRANVSKVREFFRAHPILLVMCDDLDAGQENEGASDSHKSTADDIEAFVRDSGLGLELLGGLQRFARKEVAFHSKEELLQNLAIA